MARTTAIENRERLVAAAAKLFHEKGIVATTLADVAAAAAVGLGSVYYYFRTKDDLAAAVVHRRTDIVARLIGRHREIVAPRDRLLALVDVWVSDREIDARYGCPIGRLCFELASARRPGSEAAARPFRLLLDWCEAQFRALGVGAAAGDHALHLVAALQGISLTAAVFGDPTLIDREGDHLKAWLRTL